MKDAKGPKISVCLAVRNGEAHLRAAIGSVLSQSYANFELIVTDDRSTDAATEIAVELARQDRRIVLVSDRARLGLLDSYNACMDRASGAFIKFMTPADRLHPEMLARVAEAVSSRSDVVLVSTGTAPGFDHARTCEPAHSAAWAEAAWGAGTVIPGSIVIRDCILALSNLIGEPSAVAIRRTCAGSGFDTSHGELACLEFWLRVLLQGNYLHIPEALSEVDRLTDTATGSQSALPASVLQIERFLKRFGSLVDNPDEAFGLQEHDRTIPALIRAIDYFVESYEGTPSELADRRWLSKSLIAQAVSGGTKGSPAAGLLCLLGSFRKLAFEARCQRREPVSPEIRASHRKVYLVKYARRISELEDVLRSLSVRTLNRLLPGRPSMEPPDHDVEQAIRLQLAYMKELRYQIWCQRKSAFQAVRKLVRRASSILPGCERPAGGGGTSNSGLRPASARGRPHHYYLAMGTIFQDDARFLKEWLEFHLLVGVEHFYLYNNLSSDNYAEVLEPYVSSGTVELIDWPFWNGGTMAGWRMVEREAFRDMIGRARGQATWLAMTAVDEFLFPVSEDSLGRLLQDYEGYGGLCVNWHAFGTAGVPRIPDDRLMIETLTRCAQRSHPYNLHIKTIAQPELIADCSSAHHMRYRPGYFQVNSDCQRFEGRFSPYVASDRVRINHYWTGDHWMLHSLKLPRSRRGASDRWPDEEGLIFQRLKDFNARESDRAIFRFVGQLRLRMGLDSPAPAVTASGGQPAAQEVGQPA